MSISFTSPSPSAQSCLLTFLARPDSLRCVMYVTSYPQSEQRTKADSLLQLDTLENDSPAFAVAGDAPVPAGPSSPLLHLPLSFPVSRDPLYTLTLLRVLTAPYSTHCSQTWLLVFMLFLLK